MQLTRTIAEKKGHKRPNFPQALIACVASGRGPDDAQINAIVQHIRADLQDARADLCAMWLDGPQLPRLVNAILHSQPNGNLSPAAFPAFALPAAA